MTLTTRKRENLSKTTENLEKENLLVEKPKFRKDIEGLRAIAILLVIAYHAKVPGFQGGYIGVDIFFVISGYLITWLLLYEIQTSGRVNLLSFYARRAKRLLPAAAILLAVTAAISAVIYAPFEQLGLADTAFAATTYRSNLYFSRVAVDYLGAELNTNPFLHTWTLSLEEQFYLVWPLITMAAAGAVFSKYRRHSDSQQTSQRIISYRRVMTWLVCISIASFALSLYLTGVRQPSAFFLTHARAWELTLGAIALLLPRQLAHTKRSREIIGAVGLLGLLCSAIAFTQTTPFPGLFALLPTIATALVLRAYGTEANGKTPEQTLTTRLLSNTLFQKIGQFSYGWYLWHWPILVFASILFGEVPLIWRILLVLLSLIPAFSSYHWVETPFRYSKFLKKRQVVALSMTLVFAAVGGYCSFGWKAVASDWGKSPEQIAYTESLSDNTAVYRTNCHADFFVETPDIDTCTVGSANGDKQIVLFGDSHAAQWFDVLADVAEEQNWTLTSLTKSACSYVDIETELPEVGQYTACTRWRENVLSYIQDIQPDLVIVSAFTAQSLYPFSETQWFEGTDRTVAQLSENSQAVAVLRDTPHPVINVPLCLARKEWKPEWLNQIPCQYAGDDDYAQQVYEAQAAAAENYRNVSTIDMNEFICSEDNCPLKKDGMLVYRDTDHLSARFTLTLKEELYAQIEGGLGGRGSTL